MRAVSVVIVLGLALLGALGVLNSSELMRPTTLNLGWRTLEAPLGMLLLAMAAGALVLAWAGAAIDHAQHRETQHRTEQELQAQRDLADKAEGSRLLEVQRHLDLQAQAAQHREREMLTQLGERMDRMQSQMHHQLEDVGNTLAAYIGEVEDRLERRRVLRPPDADRTPYERH